MQQFKTKFPTGYDIPDPLNDNIDMHVIVPEGKVFFATIFTLRNIQHIMDKLGMAYFSGADMLILNDLMKETIRIAITQIIEADELDTALSEIGSIEAVYGTGKNYDNLVDETILYN